MDMEANKALARRVAEELFNGRRLELVDELYAPDYVYHLPGGEVRGLAGIRHLCSTLLTAFPDLHITVEQVLAEGDRVAGRYRFSGTHLGLWDWPGQPLPPTGKVVTWVSTAISRMAEGRIAEEWESANMLSILTQLGATVTLPPTPSPA